VGIGWGLTFKFIPIFGVQIIKIMATVNYFIKGNLNPISIMLRLRDGKKTDLTIATGKTINPNYWSNEDGGRIKQRARFDNKVNIEKDLRRLRTQILLRQDPRYCKIIKKISFSIEEHINHEFYERPTETMAIVEVIISRLKFELKVMNENPDSFSVVNVQDLEDYKFSLKQILWALSSFIPNAELDYLFDKNALQHKVKMEDEFLSSKKGPNRFQRLEAVNEFCPSLIKQLQKLDISTKGKILHLITGVNGEDCYQYLFTAKYGSQKSKIDKSEIDSFKHILNSSQ